MIRRGCSVLFLALSGLLLAGCGGGGGGGDPGAVPGGMSSLNYSIPACSLTGGGGSAVSDGGSCLGAVQSPAGTSQSVGSSQYTLHAGSVVFASGVRAGR